MGLKIGLVINPVAGLGGRVGLKGSDGSDIQEQARALGATEQSEHRVSQALQTLLTYQDDIEWFTASGRMGYDCLRELGFQAQIIHYIAGQSSTAEDTSMTVAEFEQKQVDIVLFAGGDGTARDVFNGLDKSILCLGIPTGCKIYSGVFSVTPESASQIIVKILSGELFEYASSDVLDIDEEKYREGRITTRLYGEMLTPRSAEFMQNVKVAGRESEDLVKEDIAAWVTEIMDEETLYLIGSGSICMAIKDYLGIDGSLLGVDAVLGDEVLQYDGTEDELMRLIETYQGKISLIITPIGGQGILLGRGNHTICHRVIESLGMENTQVVASKGKLKTLEGRPLLVDTGNVSLNERLRGYVSVITGYDERVLYQVATVQSDS